MGALFADRRPLFAKPCHMDPLSVWPTGRGGPPYLRDGPYDVPGRGIIYEPRVSRGDVVTLSLTPRSGI